MTGMELRAWRRQHDLPLRLLAQAGGYAHVNSIRLLELGYRAVPPQVQAFVTTYQPPPCLTGPALRDWRERHGLTPAQVGLRVHATDSAVRMWELGYRRVPWRMRLYVAQHPAPATQSVPVPPPGVPDDVRAAVQAGAQTIAQVQDALPYRLAYRTVWNHLRQLTRDGVLVGRQRPGSAKRWQPAPAAGRRGVAG